MLNTDTSNPCPRHLFLLQTPLRPQGNTLPHPLPCFPEVILSLEILCLCLMTLEMNAASEIRKDQTAEELR